MIVFDGNQSDTTNFVSDRYLQINSCGYQNIKPDYTVIRRNGRKDYHILLISSGLCEVLFDGGIYTLHNGNLVIYAPGEEQRYTFVTESSSLWCHVTGIVIQELFDSSLLKSGVYFLHPNQSVTASFSNMIERFHQPDREKYANASLLELIYSISDAVLCADKNEHEDFILPILAYMNANYNASISLDTLAKKSGYSKSRFSHIFSETTGMSPMQYQNDIRLKMSCEMLSSTTLPIHEIALACGFHDPLYYSRIFRKKYSMTPTAYRKASLGI